ncbi:MAG: GGDEF domain-containing protein [bacterium]|nr:GGDEF domain-containing protein [bacterium]
MPSTYTDDFERSLEIGESAFSSLIQDTIPAWPEMYEVMYAYESGGNIDVSSAIDDLKKINPQLNSEDIAKIHDDLLSNNKMMDISEDIGSKINVEIRNIIGVMNAAGEKSDECDNALRKIETKFASVNTPEQLHSVVEILSNITRAMADNNHNLNSKLKQTTQQIDVLHKDLDTARYESNTDSLTNLANRKKFDSEMRRSINDIQKNGTDLTLLIADIDHFKKFNDTWGHQTGDQILKLVAQILKNELKGADFPARYGGEEFAVILPNTNKNDAFTVAEQIREAIAAKELFKRSTGENLGRLTVSIGIAQAAPDDIPATLIERSDKALYRAKDTGRDRCEIAPDPMMEQVQDIAV